MVNDYIKNCFLIFILGILLINIPMGIINVLFFDVKKADMIASLNAEKLKCENIMEHNNNDERDFINYERQGSDSNSFKITDRCFKVMNDFMTVYNLAIMNFYLGYFGLHFFTMLVEIVLIMYAMGIFHTLKGY